MTQTQDSDNVNNPAHYGQGKIECIEYIKDTLTHEEWVGYLRGNIIKYHHRFRYKGKPVEDLRKAEYYLGLLIEAIKEKELGSKQLTFHDYDSSPRVNESIRFKSARKT